MYIYWCNITQNEVIAGAGGGEGNDQRPTFLFPRRDGEGRRRTYTSVEIDTRVKREGN